MICKAAVWGKRPSNPISGFRELVDVTKSGSEGVLATYWYQPTRDTWGVSFRRATSLKNAPSTVKPAFATEEEAKGWIEEYVSVYGWKIVDPKWLVTR